MIFSVLYNLYSIFVTIVLISIILRITHFQLSSGANSLDRFLRVTKMLCSVTEHHPETFIDSQFLFIVRADLSFAVETAACSLQKGSVIAVPTDTIYGIAGLAQNSDSVNRIYNIKNRSYSKPVAISVGEIDDLYR